MIDQILKTIFQTRNTLENLVKVAVVKTYYPERHTAVVQFKDHDEILSAELPILTPFTQDNKAYFPLKEEQKVIVIFLPVGENTDGFIIGTLYDADNPPPVANKNKFNISFEDGTILEYDKSNHKLLIDVKGYTEIVVKNNANITVNGKTTLASKGGVDIDGGSGDLTGVVTQKCICPFTGSPHSDYSINVKISKG